MSQVPTNIKIYVRFKIIKYTVSLLKHPKQCETLNVKGKHQWWAGLCKSECPVYGGGGGWHNACLSTRHVGARVQSSCVHLHQGHPDRFTSQGLTLRDFNASLVLWYQHCHISSLADTDSMILGLIVLCGTDPYKWFKYQYIVISASWLIPDSVDIWTHCSWRDWSL